MSRLTDIREQDAADRAADIFAEIRKAMGKVPNVYLTIGDHSPAMLQQALAHSTVLHRGSLSARQLEVTSLSISEAIDCDYCLAAHIPVAKKAGSSSEQVHALRRGEYTGEMQPNASMKFIQTLMTTTGTLSEAGVAALRNAGFSDQQATKIIGAINAILPTNMMNRVNDTVIDFPEAD